MGIKKSSEFYADFKFINATFQICPKKVIKNTMKKCGKNTQNLHSFLAFLGAFV
jgi:hypothetical protein